MKKTNIRAASFLSSVALATILAVSCSTGTDKGQNENGASDGRGNMKAFTSSPAFPVIQLPEGYTIEKVADKLTYPTSVTWDDQGRMYVVEAGGAFLEEDAPARILSIENEKATEVANLDSKGIHAPVVGLVWHKGALYFTHRAKDRTGAVSRMTPDGKVTELFNGIIDSQTIFSTISE